MEDGTTTIRTGDRGVMATLSAFVMLTKPRIIELLLITTVPSMILAEGGMPDISLVLLTVVGGTLAAGGANTFNMYIDRDIDRLMERTQGRPLVTGAVSPKAALVFAVMLETLAFCLFVLWVNWLSAVLAVGACLFYVFVYSLWLKRTSKHKFQAQRQHVRRCQRQQRPRETHFKHWRIQRQRPKQQSLLAANE